MEGRVLITVAFAFAAALLAAADPYVGYIYPAGIQVGATNRLVIGGQNLNNIAGVHFSRGGLRVLKIEKVPIFLQPIGTQRRHLTKWLDRIAAGVRQEPPLPDDPHVEEWRSNSWWRALGSLDAGQIAIVELGGKMFNVVPIDARHWVIIFLVTSPVLLLGESIRFFKSRLNLRARRMS